MRSIVFLEFDVEERSRATCMDQAPPEINEQYFFLSFWFSYKIHLRFTQRKCLIILRDNSLRPLLWLISSFSFHD